MRSIAFIASVLASLTLTLEARAALTIGVVPPSLKVRKSDTPKTTPAATIKAAKNEFEAFQIVLRADAATADVSAKVSRPLLGPRGAKIPDANVTLYAERYYNVGTPSNDEGASGDWPDPLVPDVDTYVGEKRNAFPLAVPAGETRVIWVDVLVPLEATAGDYQGEIEIDVAGAKSGAVPVSLHVGTFSLPSTATFGSAFGLGSSKVAQVHCGGSSPFCATEDDAVALRTLYLRAGLDHRVSVSSTEFKAPFGASAAPYEKWVLPLIAGTGPTRLPGAKLTAIELGGSDDTIASWTTYAKSKGFADRLFYYPTDEPGSDASAWSSFIAHSDATHAADPAAEICLTSSLQDAVSFSAADEIDIMIPVLDQMYGRPGSSYAGDQRAKYDAWLAAKASRKLWMYQSCDQHGCGSCGTPSPGVKYTGWPQRVIDSSGVQDRAFAWVAWQERVTAELYWASDYQLATAWEPNGQCAFSGSGDGTIFYPGKPSIIGGTKDIPVESLRLKMIREGVEDFEYLVQVQKKNAMLAYGVASALFPTAYDTNQTADALEAARDKLFDALDSPTSPGDDAPDAGVDATVGDNAAPDAGTPSNGATASAANGPGAESCGCKTAGAPGSSPGALSLFAGAVALARRRSRVR